MIATAKDLRFNISELFKVMDKKEDVIITYRGKPRAKLVSFNEPNNNISCDAKLFGLWKDRDTEVDSYVRDIRKGRNFDI
jgi:prevent-host-death family protein